MAVSHFNALFILIWAISSETIDTLMPDICGNN